MSSNHFRVRFSALFNILQLTKLGSREMSYSRTRPTSADVDAFSELWRDVYTAWDRPGPIKSMSNGLHSALQRTGDVTAITVMAVNCHGSYITAIYLLPLRSTLMAEHALLPSTIVEPKRGFTDLT